MRLIDATRGVGFRIAALTTVLVLVSMVALGAAVYLLVNGALEAQVKARIEEEMNRILANNDASDPQVLISEIARRTQSDFVHRYAYRIATIDGNQIAGDIWVQTNRPGWGKQQLIDPIESSLGVGHILVLHVPISRNLILSIGRDIHWISEAEHELLRLLMWALLGGVILAALTAIVVTRLVAGRIDVVTAAAVAIMDGEMQHRVPVLGTGDDFDRLSQTLNLMLDRIQGLMESLSQVSNDIAHDLRTPLGRLRQGLEEARTHAKTTDDYAQSVDHAITEADGLLSTFTSLLRIAQIEAGARRSAFRKVDLSEVMRSVCEAYELSAEEGHHTLNFDICDGIRISGDRDLLVQMFANLIENALTHTPAGTAIALSLKDSTNGIVASVTDAGPGVPDDERDKIFHRFYRQETSRTTPGTGLGLSLVAAVAKLHGARLETGDNHPGLRVSIFFMPEAQA